MSEYLKLPDQCHSIIRIPEMTLSCVSRCIGIMLLVVLALSMMLINVPDLHAGTLQSVQERGRLVCGVSEGLVGFSAPDAEKRWRGFDVDFCRAVATAIFGEPDKVTYVSLNSVERFEALSSGKVDILSRNTTWTLSRDVDHKLEFVGVNYYDGQGFLTHLKNGLSSALQLDGENLCVLGGTTTTDNVRDFFTRAKMKVDIREFTKREDIVQAYRNGECKAFTSDRSALASVRTHMEAPDDHLLLPEVISKEPLGPVVRQDDSSWIELVRWTLFLLINAEEANWSSEDADKIPESSSMVISGSIAAKLGLKESWARDVIKSVGNYGEIFERNLGKNSTLKLDRGLNALWTRGGILYAPPMR
jgi:general L-amino acid transport system substrate-binding protein